MDSNHSHQLVDNVVSIRSVHVFY